MKVKQLKYKRIELEIRQLAKTLPPGAKLPAERDLAVEYKCNFLTVRKALKKLTDDGLIVRRVGSGTFMASEVRPEPSVNGRKSNRIGVLVCHQGNSYAFSVLQAMAHVALTESVELRSCWIDDFAEDALRQAATLAHEGCCALTLPWFPLDMVDVLQAFVRQCPIPVSLPALIPGLERYCFEEAQLFGVSLLSVTEALCHYFALLGHRRIAFLGPNAPSNEVLQRKLGAYTCYMSRENLPTICGLVESTPRSMDQLAERWKAHRGELAIVSYDDEHALRFLTSMHKLGMSAPHDFVITGYNDVEGSRYSDPPLSTVRQNFDYIGRWLLKSALALSRGEICQSSRQPSLDLLVRESCGGKSAVTDSLREQMRRLNVELRLEGEDGVQDAVEEDISTDVSALSECPV